MKKSLLMLFCAASFALGSMTAVSAKDLDDAKPRMEKMHEGLAKKLNLTDEQKTKAQELRKASFEKIKPLMKEMKATKEKMDTLRKEDMAAFENILTDEQKNEFKKLKQDRKLKHKKDFGKKHHFKKRFHDKDDD